MTEEIVLPSGEIVPACQSPGPPLQQPAALSLIDKAIQAGVTDADYLKKLLDLQERHEDRQAQAEYNRALCMAQGCMPAIFKDSTNKFNNTKYASLEAVLRAVQPVYLQHGFALSFGQEPHAKDGWMRVFVDVSHVAGHSRRYTGDFPLDSEGAKGGSNKTQIQAVGSAFSYARRYLLGLVFNLVFTNEDNDGQPVGQIAAAGDPERQTIVAESNSGRLSPAQATTLQNLLGELYATGCEPAGTLKRFLAVTTEQARAMFKAPNGPEITRVQDIPAALFNDACLFLRGTIEKRKAVKK